MNRSIYQPSENRDEVYAWRTPIITEVLVNDSIESGVLAFSYLHHHSKMSYLAIFASMKNESAVKPRLSLL